MRISVVIPAFNAASTIEKCLYALNNQDYQKRNFEVIVVDDGSKDQTKRLVENIVKSSDIKIILITQKNQGPGEARNNGVKRARGNAIAFTDADCIPDKNWLTVISNNLSDDSNVYLGGCTYTRDTLIQPWIIAPAGHTRVTANLALKKESFQKVGFSSEFPGLLYQDTDLAIRLENSGLEYRYVKDMKVQHPANILGLKRVIYRSKAREYEVLMYKKYGGRIKSTIHPFFQPRIFNRVSISSVFLLFTLVLATVSVLYGFAQYILIGTLVLAILFILKGYKVLVSGTSTRKVTLTDKIKTAAFISLHTILYTFYRIKGSIRFKYLLI